MAQTSVYTMEGFIADVRQVFASTDDPRAQAQGAAGHMKKLLAVPGWLEEKVNLPSEGGNSSGGLHLDEEYGHPGPGFWLMYSIQSPGDAARQVAGVAPHDHGASWVVYGVYKGAIEQTKWRWVYPEGDRTSPELKQSESWTQRNGEVAFFLPGEIHTQFNVNDGLTMVVRLEGQKLDRVVRHRYDPQANSASIQASR